MKTYIVTVLIFLVPCSSYCQDLNIQFAKPFYLQIDSPKRFTNYYNTGFDSITIENADLIYLTNFKKLSNIESIRQLTPVRIKINCFYSLIDSSVNLIEYSWEADREEMNLMFKQFERNKKRISNYFKSAGKADYNDAFYRNWSGHVATWSNKNVTVIQWFYVTTQNKIGIKVFTW